MADVKLDGLTKRFGAFTAVDGVSLAVPSGALLAVLGPSGCGKTTLLRLIAGLEVADEGTITIGSATVAAPGRHVPPEARGIGVVFQSYALWPHMTVAENAAYPLRVAGLARADRDIRVAEAIATVRLDALAGRRPHELSGGQQQRVALARCLTQRPPVILMDEPLANLDRNLREEMLAELQAFHRASGATTVFITHDQGEALSIADRIVVMLDGRIAQEGAPEAVYREPARAAVARFLGGAGLIEASVEGAVAMAVDGAAIPISSRTTHVSASRGLLAVRTEDVALGGGPMRARVTAVRYLGERYLVDLDAGPGVRELRAFATTRPLVGESISFAVSRAHLMPLD